MEQFDKHVKNHKRYLAYKYEGKPLNRTTPDMEFAILPEKIKLNVTRQSMTEYLKENPQLPDAAKKEVAYDLEITEKILDRRFNQELNPNGPQKSINPPDKDPNTSIVIYDNPNGWVIGREEEGVITKDLSGPYGRLPDAHKAYEKIKEFRGTLKEIGTGNLKTLSKMFDDQKEQDPESGLKSELIKDYLAHDREPKKEIAIEETFEIEYRSR